MRIHPASFLSVAVLMAGSAAHAQAMSVSSASFGDGGTLSSVHANDANGCGGHSITPQVAWAGLPPATKSVAVTLVDPDGGQGLGVTHWVAYGIAPSRGQIRQGEAPASIDGITVGRNSVGAAAYRGICPPVGDVPHHYVLTVIATDLPPDALPAGLTREEMLAAMKGHGLVSQSVIGRYGR